MYPEFVLAEAEQKQAWLQTRTGAIVGRRTAERFHWKIGDRVPIQSPIWPHEGGKRTWEFDIVGIYDGAKKGTDTTQFFFRYDYFDEARALRQGTGGLVHRPGQGSRPSRRQSPQRIDEEFANSPAETKTEPEGAFVQGFAKQIGDIGTDHHRRS